MLTPQIASATHIVGGVVNYELVDVDKSEYNITFHVYFDCENGTPEAISTDATIYVSIYDAGTNAYISNFTMNRGAPNYLNKANYSCVVPPEGVCVVEYVYSTKRVLPIRKNGLIIAFQRCCRNNTINNIVAPEATGATYWTKIPPITVPNSSAKFNELPPNYVCVDAPLQVDHSATDADGDSLEYFLYRPYAGADRQTPRPTTASTPPFDQIFWIGSYDEDNMMGGDPKLTIDSKTGELNVTPNTLGQFVIGVGVREYRNGKVISETLRDYQFNVIKCEFDILANFVTKANGTTGDAYVFECQDTVYFENRSLKAEKYFWNFGDPTTDSDTSSEKNPSYSYPGNGDYTVTLKVENSICEDVYKFGIKIRSKRPFDLGPDQHFCLPISKIINTNATDATTVKWNTGQSGVWIRARDSGEYIATVSYGKCVYKDSVRLYLHAMNMDLQDDSLFCDDVDIVIDAGVNALSYQWSTSPKDTSRLIRINEPGVYTLTVKNEYCTEIDSIRLWVADIPQVNDAFYCNEFVHTAQVEPVEEGSYLWSNGQRGQSAQFDQPGIFWVRQTQRHCVKSDSFEIVNIVLTVDLGPDQHFCDVVDGQLIVNNTKVSYLWSTGQTVSTIVLDTPNLYWVRITDENSCVASDTVSVTMTLSPILNLGVDTTICLSTILTLGPPSNAQLSNFLWSTGEESRTIEVHDEGIYSLWMEDVFGCTAEDSIEIWIDPNAMPSDLYVPNAFTPNGDGLNDQFPYSEPVTQTDYYVMVFTRWGEKVFDSREQSNTNWDGYYQGKLVPTQTFIYYMEYTGCDGLRYVRKGSVNPIY